MTENFNDIWKTDGSIAGTTDSGFEIYIPDEEWDEIQRQGSENIGNWEPITVDSVRDIVSSQDRLPDGAVTAKRENICESIDSNGHVDAENSEDSRLCAGLLLEYLLEQSIYQERDGEIVLLERLDNQLELKQTLNWAAYISYIHSKGDKLHELHEKSKNNVGNSPSTVDLLEELKEITGEKWQPVGYNYHNLPIPPDGVEDEKRYQEILEILNRRQHLDGTQPNPSQLEQINSKLKNAEESLRRGDVSDIPWVDLTSLRERVRID